MADVPLEKALDNIQFGTLVVDAEGIVTPGAPCCPAKNLGGHFRRFEYWLELSRPRSHNRQAVAAAGIATGGTVLIPGCSPGRPTEGGKS